MLSATELDRLKALATGPELDEAVCRLVGIKPSPGFAKNKDGLFVNPIEKYPPVSTDIEAAWLVRDALEKHDWRMTLYAPGAFTDEGLPTSDIAAGRWSACFSRMDNSTRLPGENSSAFRRRIRSFPCFAHEEADTAPLAICRAAIAAMGGGQ